jgi:LysM repeat protein
MKRSPISFFYSPLTLLPCSLALSIILPSCTGQNKSYTGNNPTGHGPFNSRGDYVEEWADSPSRWKSGGLFGGKTPPPVPQDEQGLLAGNDNPPANLSPIGSGSGTSKTSPPHEVKLARIEPTRSVSSTTPKPKTSVSSTTPKPKPKTSVASTKPKPKPVAVKPKTSPSTRVIVKKGDTLYGLALRYKTSVSAIQRANGISGSNLAIGKSLVIPSK